MNRTNIFGCHIDQNTDDIPIIFKSTKNYFENRGYTDEGIFRVSGSITTIQEYKDRYERGEQIEYDKDEDPHVVAGLLKLWIRLLPESIFTKDLIKCMLTECSHNENQLNLDNLISIMGYLPFNNFLILYSLFDLLKKIENNSSVNWMTSDNLAIVFSPSLIWVDEMGDSFKYGNTPNYIISNLITNYDQIFQNLFPVIKNRSIIIKVNNVRKNPDDVFNEDDVYALYSRSSKKHLDGRRGKEKHPLMTKRNPQGDIFLNWNLKKTIEGYYHIYSLSSQRYLKAKKEKAEMVDTVSSETKILWEIKKTCDGFYSIKSVHNQKYLDGRGMGFHPHLTNKNPEDDHHLNWKINKMN